MKTFKLTVGTETAVFEVPDTASLEHLVEFLIGMGCTIRPAVEEEGAETFSEEAEELGMTYSEWFRRYVSDW